MLYGTRTQIDPIVQISDLTKLLRHAREQVKIRRKLSSFAVDSEKKTVAKAFRGIL